MDYCWIGTFLGMPTMSDQAGQQGVRSNVEWHAESHVSRALIHLVSVFPVN